MLLRPHHWVKSAFVLIGPLYGLADARDRAWESLLIPALFAAAAFALASSACYIINDILDADKDRLHPRKKHRPIASGAVSTRAALAIACVLVVLAAIALMLVDSAGRTWVAILCGAYVFNVLAYSAFLKHRVIADVISLSLGFVIRVLAGCGAAGVAPSPWLLNCTFFLAMFLAFGKRLGERRTMGDEAASTRRVHAAYTDDLLRMTVVVTGVAALLTYAGYVQARALTAGSQFFGLSLGSTAGFSPLWITMLPATYGLLRCIVLLERGTYDDPTELAVRDRATQAAGMIFAIITLGVLIGRSGS